MKIKLKNTPDQVELIKATGSKNKVVAAEAMQALADFVTPVAQKVIEFAPSSNKLFKDFSFDSNTSPSIPMDLYFNEGQGLITVWSQSMAGGLPSNQAYGSDELKIATYQLDSAVSWSNRYARQARLDVVSKHISKMLNEVAIKIDKNNWAVALRALAEASTNTLSHVIAAGTANIFQLDDLNRLMTRIRRINTAFNAGTPAVEVKGITDLVVSPEITEQIRAFAYQPMNTRGVPNSDESTVIPLPDAIREQIYRSAGASEIYGVAITELLEFGDGEKYNQLFDTYYTGTFAPATDQLVLGFDASQDSCLSPIAQDSETGNTFETDVDDQFVKRQDKSGIFGKCEKGSIVVRSQCLVGLTV